MSTKTINFKGRVGGVTYDDPEAFEQAARGLGHTGVMSRGGKWKLGTDLALEIDGARVEGQVWSRGPSKETYWVALSDGRYALFGSRRSVILRLTDARGMSVEGVGTARVAS